MDPFLQDAQHLRLAPPSGNLANFVEKDGLDWWRQLESARLDRPAPLVQRLGLAAEQLAFDQRRRDRGAVDRDHPPSPALAETVDGVRKDFLAGARFAEQEHRRIGSGDSVQLLEHAPDGVAFGDHVPSGTQAADLSTQLDVLDRQPIANVLHSSDGVLAVDGIDSGGMADINDRQHDERLPGRGDQPSDFDGDLCAVLAASSELGHAQRRQGCRGVAGQQCVTDTSGTLVGERKQHAQTLANELRWLVAERVVERRIGEQDGAVVVTDDHAHGYELEHALRSSDLSTVCVTRRLHPNSARTIDAGATTR